ncbi:hypothetical protein GCM10007235_04440 [Pseudoxanthomonas indica]|nr:hypothetical protein GCM10007235_04440 [Pseudoxanthomonas indica]
MVEWGYVRINACPANALTASRNPDATIQQANSPLSQGAIRTAGANGGLEVHSGAQGLQKQTLGIPCAAWKRAP